MARTIADVLSSLGIEPDEEALKHYGVKGMVRGVRKAEEDTSDPTGPFSDADIEKRLTSTPGWNRLNSRQKKLKIAVYKKALEKTIASRGKAPKTPSAKNGNEGFATFVRDFKPTPKVPTGANRKSLS